MTFSGFLSLIASLVPRPHPQLRKCQTSSFVVVLRQHVSNSGERIKSLVHFKSRGCPGIICHQTTLSLGRCGLGMRLFYFVLQQKCHMNSQYSSTNDRPMSRAQPQLPRYSQFCGYAESACSEFWTAKEISPEV